MIDDSCVIVYSLLYKFVYFQYSSNVWRILYRVQLGRNMPKIDEVPDDVEMDEAMEDVEVIGEHDDNEEESDDDEEDDDVSTLLKFCVFFCSLLC